MTEPAASDPSSTNPRPPPNHEIWAALVGMTLWLIAFVVLVVFFRHDLQRHHATWWLWSCGLGLGLGLYGLRFAYRRGR